MTFTLSYNNIQFDLTPYIAKSGLQWQRQDVDGPNAGRLLSGELQRDRRATKIRFDVTCIPLTAKQLSNILTMIAPEWVTLTYTDPVTNSVKSGTFYSNNFPATCYGTWIRGQELWTGLAFPLIQK